MLIGILQTGHAPEALRDDLGDYDAMFAQLLDRHGFTFRSWDVEGLDFPNSPAAADGWLITGSRHGAYEDHPWIPPLEQFIRGCINARVPMVGICFGHQIIAQALGGRVEKSPKGWGVGRMVYAWAGRGEVALNAWHQDQVTALPQGAEITATTPFCEAAALLYGDQAFTIQAHPEFDRTMVEGLLTHRAAKVPENRQAVARSNLDQPIDADIAAQDIAAFFKMPREAHP